MVEEVDLVTPGVASGGLSLVPTVSLALLPVMLIQVVPRILNTPSELVKENWARKMVPQYHLLVVTELSLLPTITHQQ